MIHDFFFCRLTFVTCIWFSSHFFFAFLSQFYLFRFWFFSVAFFFFFATNRVLTSFGRSGCYFTWFFFSSGLFFADATNKSSVQHRCKKEKHHTHHTIVVYYSMIYCCDTVLTAVRVTTLAWQECTVYPQFSCRLLPSTPKKRILSRKKIAHLTTQWPTAYGCVPGKYVQRKRL